MTKISAKHLATGDRVEFPRLGWRRLCEMHHSSWLSVSFICDDRKHRAFKPDQLVEAELRTDNAIVPREGEILRLDLESGRTSVISPSLMSFSSEISKSYHALRARVTTLPDIAALAELRRGATLFTERAVYTMPETDLIRYVPLLKDITAFDWQGL